MVANTSEYYVPNYAGGGDAIFNKDMVRTMGLPAGAKKINAAGGYVPNFATLPLLNSLNPRQLGRLKAGNTINIEGKSVTAKDFGTTPEALKSSSAFTAPSTVSAQSKKALTSKEAATSLILDAGGKIGIASLFGESPATGATTTKLSSEDLKALKELSIQTLKRLH